MDRGMAFVSPQDREGESLRDEDWTALDPEMDRGMALVFP